MIAEPSCAVSELAWIMQASAGVYVRCVRARWIDAMVRSVEAENTFAPKMVQGKV